MISSRLGLLLVLSAAVACGGSTVASVTDGGGADVVTASPEAGHDAGDAMASVPEAGGDADAAPAPLGEPTFTPPSGATIEGQFGTVTIAPPISFPQARVFYTLDGSTPSSKHGTLYAGPFQLQGPASCTAVSQTVTAVATYPGYVDSPPASATYTVTNDDGDGSIPPVVFSAMSMSSNNDFPLTLSATPGASICYTTDGSIPACDATATCSGKAATYTQPLRIDGSLSNPATGGVTVTAIGCFLGTQPPSCGLLSSQLVSQTYTLEAAPPTMTNPAPGIVSTGATPTLATATLSSITVTDAVSIHMTTDGSTPTCNSGTALPGSSTVGPLTASTTVKAIACKGGYLPSSVASFVYTVQ